MEISELKKAVHKDLIEQKEQERLKNVKANSILENIIMYTRKDDRLCKGIKDGLDQNGIKYEERDIEEYRKEYSTIVAATNNGNLPVFNINNHYIHHGRDFYNTPQLVKIARTYAHPEFTEPPFEIYLREQIKSINHNISKSLGQLTQSIQPVIKVLSDLAKEDQEDSKKDNEKKNK